MKKIVWQSEYQALVNSFQKKTILSDSRGGQIYEYLAATVLEKNYQVIMDALTPRGDNENSFHYWYQLHKNSSAGDAFIKSPSVILHGKRRLNTVEVGMLHHIYFDVKKRSIKGNLSLLILKKRLRTLDTVVTVSKFWHDYVQEIGCRDVQTIYNAFDLGEFVFHDQDKRDFLEQYNIHTDRPIIYIGYADARKGILEVYNELKDQQYTLVMTGPHNTKISLPILRLYLNRRDYLRLLHACDVVTAMSTIDEGWSRIAHEAMLCRTPVIGSGSGGMRELLQGGKQVICTDPVLLPEMVREVLKMREIYALNGFMFAKQFDLPYFAQAWNSLLQERIGP